MASPLPSYLQATTKDHWSIISSFVASRDLCAAALVSQQWNHIFMHHLWGNPASHFGVENDEVYVALVRFKRVLSWARPTTRELTHTLRLPPAQAELYEGPRAEWLRDILLRLPRLQSLIVSGLPFFDHAALCSLLDTENREASFGEREQSYSLRLLEASNAFNTTSISLAQALRCFTSLTYLDLSYTYPARDARVFDALHSLQGLQILKIRSIGLLDEHLQSICKSLRLRLRSLDIRDNNVTDKGVRYILQDCVIPVSQAQAVLRRNVVNSRGIPTSMQGYYEFDLPPVYKSEYQDSAVHSQYTSDFCYQVGFEDAVGSGLTHLYLAGNKVSVSVIVDALRLQRLHVLDTGALIREVQPTRSASTSQWYNRITGAEGLIPVLRNSEHALTYLRTHHGLVTQLIEPQSTVVGPMELEGSAVESPHVGELDVPIIVELEADSSRHELSGGAALFEMEGSPVPGSSPFSDRPEDNTGTRETDLRPMVSRPTSNDAPEAVISSRVVSPLPEGLFPPTTSHGAPLSSSSVSPLPYISPFLPPSSTGREIATHLHTLGPPQSAPISRARSWSGVLADRDARLAYIQSQPHALLPSMLPTLRTLVLTDVPTYSNSKTASNRLVSFITACAEQAHWAKLEARYTYSLPPGRDRAAAEQTHINSLFALKDVVLEMAPTPSPVHQSHPRAASPGNSYRSMAEDPDCEILWNAATNDFSFFGQEADEECGVLEAEARKPTLASQMEKMLVDETPSVYQQRGHEPTNQLIDTLANLSSFRATKRQQYAAAVARGVTDPYIEGYWEGIITVIRPG